MMKLDDMGELMNRHFLPLMGVILLWCIFFIMSKRLIRSEFEKEAIAAGAATYQNPSHEFVWKAK